MDDTQIARTYGRRVRAQRRRKGMSVAALAKAVGVSRAAVYQWEAGTTCPRPAQQLKIAEALVVSWSLLFELESLTPTTDDAA